MQEIRRTKLFCELHEPFVRDEQTDSRRRRGRGAIATFPPEWVPLAVQGPLAFETLDDGGR
ncbi:hypothetical protein ColTof4_02379 [Colletotrichum tofieldiae]|nr:hypothetical protein ColTof3_09333 [Colletotrichum tofieldiae]GKT69956.1 hypothetical protein ColTof4_02379 [Colletotrichum tofieldiae]GKT92975.1 hypothetical protein Ct61P_10825 [Colletotrichum tofieldiae]